MNYLFLFLVCVAQITYTKHRQYFSKRQKAIITNYVLRNVRTYPHNRTDNDHNHIALCITYYTQIAHQDIETPLQTVSTPTQNTISVPEQSTESTPAQQSIIAQIDSAQSTPAAQITETPKVKTIHDVIKFFKAGHTAPQNPTVFLEIISTYFNTHWEYTFYATWKKMYESHRETETLSKSLIYLAQAYGKDTMYTFYTGYEPYSIAYLLEHVCYLDQTSIDRLP